jgi:hypothetical protein
VPLRRSFAVSHRFGVQNVIAMSAQELQLLNDATIEVELEVAGEIRTIRGKGRYDASDADLGPTLSVLVSDPTGDFELLLPESALASLKKSDRSGCDYQISLVKAPPS